nr:DUF1223 domain-containing protein [Flavobacterium sp. ASV13]
MKTKSIVVLVGIALLTLLLINTFIYPLSKPSFETSNSKSFAVVELFTSEGCSSCPPADQLIAQLEQDTQNKNIYILAYHVDYWDRLGWKDHFSAREFTQHQEQYLEWLNLHIMYTPQFVINGSAEFAGDNKATLYSKVSDATQANAGSDLVLIPALSGENILVTYNTDSKQKNTSVFIALVQKKAATKVERGENSGSLLHHVQIVRDFASQSLQGAVGKIIMAKPENFDSGNFEVIGFLQNDTTGKISGAAKAIIK